MNSSSVNARARAASRCSFWRYFGKRWGKGGRKKGIMRKERRRERPDEVKGQRLQQPPPSFLCDTNLEVVDELHLLLEACDEVGALLFEGLAPRLCSVCPRALGLSAARIVRPLVGKLLLLAGNNLGCSVELCLLGLGTGVGGLGETLCSGQVLSQQVNLLF